jgi:hypothetical protein
MVKSIDNNGLQSLNQNPFRPDDYFAAALSRIYRVSGLRMYDVLRRPETRTRLLDLVGRVERAWRQGEQTDRWAVFGRAVDRLKWFWLELLDADGASPERN